MNDQLFTVVVTIIGILLTALGSLAVFLLSLIFQKQAGTEEKMGMALAKIEALQTSYQVHDRDIEKIKERLPEFCTKDDCPERVKERKTA